MAIGGNSKPIVSSLILLVLLGFCTDFIFGRPGGAPPSACSSSLTPQHGFNPQNSATNPYSLSTTDTVFDGATTQVIPVTVSWPSNVYLRGIILQAREVGKVTPVGSWTIPNSHLVNFQLMRCSLTGDTITHTNRNDKAGDVTFMWQLPDPSKRVGNVQFVASFVQNTQTYWTQVTSNVLNDPCWPNPCLYDGICGITGNTYTCQCPNGLSGPNCDSCVSNPCFNNAVCTSSSTGYTCDCPSGFMGTRCDAVAPVTDGCLSNPCQNGGTCFRGDGGTYICTCPPEFMGSDRCQTSVASSPCASLPCQNDGVCYTYSDDSGFLCLCKEGFTGIMCTINSDACNPINPCQNGATCMLTNDTILGYACMCPAGWVGTLCEQETPCEPNPCYFGSTCNPANNDRGYNCNCMMGYTGNNCETSIVNSPCDSNPCMNEGSCYQSDTAPPTYFCSCQTGYTGDSCQLPVLLACSSNPCFNGGLCSVSETNVYHCTCTPVFIGDQCQFLIDPCASNPCLNNGACASDENGYTCTCYNFFTGDRCQSQSACASMPCQNGGTCVGSVTEFACNCPSLYTGTTCGEFNFDPCMLNPCNNNGQCSSSGTTFTCDCNPGWLGTSCNTPVCDPSPCLNGGICSPSDVHPRYMCACPSTYYGNTCENPVPCNSDPCLNGGHCFSSFGVDSYICQCIQSYTGTNCEDPPVNPCQSQPCMNAGTCVTSTSSNPPIYTCACLMSFEGDHCEIAVNPCGSNPCQNGGQCFTSTSGTDYTCTCPQTHMGKNCETVIVDACNSDPCLNGGTCSVTSNGGYSCSCPGTHIGINCEYFVSPCASNPCTNGGQCSIGANNIYVCACPQTHSGTNCETLVDSCASLPCLNGGQCILGNSGGFTCNCPPTHTGDTCDFSVSMCELEPCLNGGTCFTGPGNTYTCRCPDTHSGADCETLVSPCDSSPCANGGQCLIGNGFIGYACACTSGYTGDNCQIPVVNACNSDPCSNDGVCASTGSNSFSCDCPTPFSGITCEIDNTCSVFTPCRNGGTCTLIGPQQYQCSCAESYSGDNCEIYSNPCEVSQPCVTGTCLNLGSSFSCLCENDYSGQYCETNLCTRTASGCLNGGVCNTVTLTCECPLGFTGSECKETVTLPPTFTNCPEPILTYPLEQGTNMATITLTGPITARDSNQQSLPVIREEGPSLTFDGDLEVTFEEAYREGVEFVYSATDFANSRATCEFKIRLTDDEVPTVECPADIREVTTENTVPIMFDGVTASDNLGEPRIFYSTINGDRKVDVESGAQFEATGDPVSIIVTAKDSFDNEAVCTLTVTVYKQDTDCSHFPDVSNGQADCIINEEGIRECTVTCDTDYFLSVPSPASYTCGKSEADKDSVWRPAPNANSICLPISLGKFMKTVTVIFDIDSEDCAAGDTTFENNIGTNIIEALSNSGLCTFNKVTACNRDNYNIRCGDVGNNRRRRAVTDLTVDIGVSGRVDSDTNVTAVQNDIDMLAAEISNLADSGILMIEVGGEMIPSKDGSMISQDYETTCIEGQMPVDDGCVSCPTGTFYNYETTKCEFCDLNTYQEDNEQSTCVPCPDDKITKSTGSFQLAQCTDKAGQQTIWTTTLIAVIGAAGGLVVLLILLIIILCCCRLCCSNEDDFASDSIGNLTHLNKAYEEDDEQEMTFTGTMDNGRASVRTYQSIPANGYAHHDNNGNGYMHESNGYNHDSTYTNGHVANGHVHEPDFDDDRLVRIPSMSETVYNSQYGNINEKGQVPDTPPPPPPVGAPAPPPPPPPPPM